MSYTVHGNIYVTIQLKNYDTEIIKLIDNSTDFNYLEKCIEFIDKILPYCLNLNSVTTIMDTKFVIHMGCDKLYCMISLFKNRIEFEWFENGWHYQDECSLDDSFDKILEQFSKTPLYKRPESIKVATAAKCDSE